MISRTEVFAAIEKERAYQDQTYRPDETLSSGQTRQTRDLDVTPHLVLLDLYIQRAKAAWNVKGTNEPALKEILKIAAIAVRAMERAGGSSVVLAAGAR